MVLVKASRFIFDQNYYFAINQKFVFKKRKNKMDEEVIEKGFLKDSFNGFNNTDTVFEFESGSKWRQAEYNYQYYYEYNPKAKIIRKNGRYYIKVDNISEMVEVEEIY